MSRHIRNEQCPECAKIGRDKGKNNLGVYDDGHAYCWACGYYKPSSTISWKPRDVDESSQEKSIILPSDVDTYIPAEPLSWLASYNITYLDIIHHRLLWSEYYKQLIFPYFDKYGNLVAWQGRCFEPSLKRKWFSQGDLSKLYHIIPQQKTYDRVILVEDIVSAIKVGHIEPTMPLFTSTAVNRLSGLNRVTNTLVWWLDPDMKIKSLKEVEKAKSLGFNATVLFTDKDPKEYSLEEIKCLLNTNILNDLVMKKF